MGQNREVPVTAVPGETPAASGAGTADLTADAQVEAAEIPPALVAQSLGQYMRAWLLQIRSGNSGVLPVVLAIVIVAVASRSSPPSTPSCGRATSCTSSG